ncbi:MAG: nodulation protein NfeD [Pirellulales bacterium]
MSRSVCNVDRHSLRARGLRCLLLAPLVLAAARVRPGWSEERQPAREFSTGVLIRFEGPITPLLEQYFYRKLDDAKKRGADLIIVEIDSPGGFLDASLNIAERLRDLSWAHTVAFVPGEALSGAAITALACDDIVMAPNARIGDAGPIFQGEDALFRHAPEKIRSDLARRVRDLAEAKGRPPAVAEAMVDMDLVVFHVQNKRTGKETFMADHEIASADHPDAWEKGPPIIESREKHFLTVNGIRAVELHLAQGNAQTRRDLEEEYDLREALVILKPTSVDHAVTILNFPIVTGLLFVVGLIALYIEFSAPGIGMGGLIAGLCFALFFWSRFLGGTAGWLEVVLFMAGLVFLAMEWFVIPGFGVAGISGLFLIFLSVLMAGQHFLIPHTSRELSTSLNSIMVLSSSGIAFVVAAMVISHYFKVIPVMRWLVLEPPTAKSTAAAGDKDAPGEPNVAVSDHRFPVQVGDWGTAESLLRPAGKVRFEDHYVDVVTDGSFVEPGRPVRIIEISGNRVVVREIAEKA